MANWFILCQEKMFKIKQFVHTFKLDYFIEIRKTMYMLMNV